MSLQSLIDDFAFLDDWEDRFKYVIELGKALPPLPDEAYSDANKVQGCASQVWIVCDRAPANDGTLSFHGDSDAHIVKGLLAILLQLYAAKTPDEILAIDAHGFFKQIGLEEHLTAQRAGGLASMIKTVRAHALAQKELQG